MQSQRLLMRGLARPGQPLGPSLFRPVLQRRLESTAARKTVEIPASGQPPLVGAADNAFNRERAAIKAHAAKSSALWRKLMWYVTMPCLILGGVNAWVLWNEHWEHWEHQPPPSERPQYSYLNIRTRKFPWGDGNKTLFWNDKVNYLPPDKVQ